MANNEFYSRIIHKHDTEENWIKAINFIPKQGEIIIYDKDDNYNYERMKIGNGVTNVNNLPFIMEKDINGNNIVNTYATISKSFPRLGFNALTTKYGSTVTDTPTNWANLGTCNCVLGEADRAIMSTLPVQDYNSHMFNFVVSAEASAVHQIIFPMIVEATIYHRYGKNNEWTTDWIKLFDNNDIIPITNGGTGATTAAGVLTKLGITASAAELNRLDGVTTNPEEFNYVKGTTSNIQDQLNKRFKRLGDNPLTNLNNSEPDPDVVYIDNPAAWAVIGTGQCYIGAEDKAIITNYPGSYNSHMLNFVTMGDTNCFVHQIIFTTAGKIYHRYGVADMWTADWVELFDSSNLDSVEIIDATGSTNDMNTIFKSGKQVKVYRTDIDTLNTPYKAGKTGTLTGANIFTITGSTTYGTQIAFINGGNNQYVRKMSNGTIGEWTKVITETDLSGYATAAQGTKADNAMPKSGGTFTGAVDMKYNNITAGTQPTSTGGGYYFNFQDTAGTDITKLGTTYATDGANYFQITQQNLNAVTTQFARLRLGYNANNLPYCQLYTSKDGAWTHPMAPLATLRNIEVRTTSASGTLQSTGKIICVRK